MTLTGFYKTIIGVATTVLVVIVVSTVLYYWLLTISGYTGQDRGVAVSIETVSYNEGALEVTVRNNGNTKATVKYTHVEAYGNTICSTGTHITLEPGESNTIKLDCNLKKQQTYTVKIAVEGGEARYVFKPG